MTREEAEIYARNMSYEDALFNLTKARAIPYKKATLIKVYELIQALEQEPCDAVSRQAVLDLMQMRMGGKELYMAVYDLPPVNPQPCDDAISREDAIKAQCEACDICGNARYTKCQYFMQGCNEVKCLRDLPSITQKPETVTEFADRCRECGARYGKLLKQKTGHWICHYDEDEKVGWYECDRCHTERAFNTKFCPDCGACMREGRTLDEFIEDSKESEVRNDT